MMMESPRAKTLAIILALAATTAALPLAATGSGNATPFQEEWEDGLDGWTVTGDGAAVDCATGSPGCSLQISPPCCGNVTRVTRAVDLPLTGAAAFTFRFHATARYGDTDSHLRLRLDDGTTASLSVTDGIGDNTGLALQVSGHPNEAFGNWERANRWYEAAIVLDPEADLAQAQVRTLDGALIGLSHPLSIPAGASAITAIEIEAVSWPGRHAAYGYDSLGLTEGGIDRVPSVPRNFSVAPGDGNITLTWQAPAYPGAGLSEYRVYRARESSSPRTLHATLGPDALGYVDADLPDSSRHVYWVAAANAEGEGPLTPLRYGWTWGPPHHPYDVRVGHGATGNVIDWRNNGDNGYPVTEWRIHRANETGAFHLVGTTPGATLSHLDADRPDNATWTYRITAVNQKGESAPSPAAKLQAGMPPHPVGFTARPHPDRVTLSWAPHPEPSAAPVTHYLIERDSWTLDGYNWEGATFTTPATTFEDYAVNETRYYRYSVRAVAALPGHPSDEEYAYLPGPPSEPRNLHAERTSFHDVRLTWEVPVENPHLVDHYVVHRGVDGATPTPWAWVDKDDLSYEDTWVDLDHTYTYHVIASKGWNDHEQLPSNTVTVNVTSTPFPPRNLTATGRFGEVSLAWDAPAVEGPAFAYQYCISRATVFPAEEARPLECIWRDWSDPEVDYVDRDVLPGLTYTYRVTSRDPWHGDSEPTDPATATALPPSPPWPLT